MQRLKQILKTVDPKVVHTSQWLWAGGFRKLWLSSDISVDETKKTKCTWCAEFPLKIKVLSYIPGDQDNCSLLIILSPCWQLACPILFSIKQFGGVTKRMDPAPVVGFYILPISRRR
jgi:hypothetical protein